MFIAVPFSVAVALRGSSTVARRGTRRERLRQAQFAQRSPGRARFCLQVSDALVTNGLHVHIERKRYILFYFVQPTLAESSIQVTVCFMYLKQGIGPHAW